jgi:hypothetical protein
MGGSLMRVLVTGSAGFIRIHRSETTLLLSYDVIRLDISFAARRSKLRQLPGARRFEPRSEGVTCVS